MKPSLSNLEKSGGVISQIFTNVPSVAKPKDLIRNKPLLKGSGGLKGARGLLSPRPNPQRTVKQMSSNAYLNKVAQILSDENKSVAKTFGLQTVAGIPAHIAGGILGGKLGSKYLNGTASTLNRTANAATAGLRGKLGAMGPTGAKISKALKAGKGSGTGLGVGLGMAVMGGLTDIAALKHSLHGKIKDEQHS